MDLLSGQTLSGMERWSRGAAGVSSLAFTAAGMAGSYNPSLRSFTLDSSARAAARAAESATMARRGMAATSAAMEPEYMAAWERYLGRRGITIEKDANAFLDALGEGYEALYDPNVKTMYLRTNPTKSAFLEEAFHARQHLRSVPDFMEYNGKIIDRWEFEAQRSLIRNRHRLGIPNDQTRQTIENLRDVYNGTY